MPNILVPYAKLDSILDEFNDQLLWFVLMNPVAGGNDVARDESIIIRVVLPQEDPGTVDLTTLSMIIEIDRGAGWETIYDGVTFAAPWDGSSTVTDCDGSSLYAYREFSCIPGTDVFPDSSTVQVRVAATNNLPDDGWGSFDWGNQEWGIGVIGGTAEGSADFSFDVIDETIPTVLQVEAVGRRTIRVTYSESMSPETIDGFASVESTVEPASWPDSGSLPWEFGVIIDGVQQIVTVDDTMIQGNTVDPDELAFCLTALLSGGVVDVEGTIIRIRTIADGDNRSIQVVSGNGASILGFPDTEYRGAYNGVLDPSNYRVTRHNVYPVPAVNLEIIDAQFDQGSTSVVNLTAQWPMTHDAPYVLHIDDDITDTAGNVVDSSTLSNAFVGFKPHWPENRDTEIRLPRVIWDHDNDDVMRGIINIWQEFEDQLVCDIDEFWDLLSPDTIEDDIIDLALADQGNPFDWADLDLDSNEKRKLLELLSSIYESKGLGPGIESTIYLLLGIPIEIESHVASGWRLGVDTLGDSYPAVVKARNAGPYDLSGGRTLEVVVNETESQLLSFVDDDFENPSVATANEVVDVINARLDGGGAELRDDSSGPGFILYSNYYGPGGSIQVLGGTANLAFNFDILLHSSSGGCRLAPGDERSIRTFDLVYGDVVPSDEQIVLIRRIAQYMKAANEFIGNIRSAKVYESDVRWLLGGSLLGNDTVVG